MNLRADATQGANPSASRDNSPLVELIAEMRWAPPSPAQPPQQLGGGVMFVAGSPSKVDEFFMQFGAKANSLGYTEVERLGMTGFPLVMHQPVFRFKKAGAEEDGSLFQVGPGLFTANALPPYESWERFGPVVRNGVRAMLATRPREERDAPFLGASLRYIDAFTSHHTAGRDVMTFLRDVFRINVSIPDALSRHLPEGSAILPMLQLQVPMPSGMHMSLAIGEGTSPTGQTIMMDMSVSSGPLPATEDAVMNALNVAHDAIRESFEALIQPIDHLMPRRQAGVAP